MGRTDIVSEVVKTQRMAELVRTKQTYCPRAKSIIH